MSYELAERAADIALKSIAKGSPAPEAFTRIRAAVLPSLPDSVGAVAAGLDLGADIDAVCEQFAHVLTTEPPDEEINGLCFGLAEMIFGKEDGSPPDPGAKPEHTLYICGSARFDPEDTDWPCDPEWWPETRYFIIPSFKALSDACATLDSDASWLVACGLIEPLSILLVGEACRRVDRKTLLGAAGWRGIGSGFDGGDLRDIGVVTQDGFVSPALVESAPAPAPRKSSKPTTKKTKVASPKRAKGKKSKAKGSSSKKGSTKKASAKKAARKAGPRTQAKKKVTRKAATKKAATKKPARRASMKRATRPAR